MLELGQGDVGRFEGEARDQSRLGGKSGGQKDEAEALLKQLYSLNKKDQARFIELLEQDGVI